MPRPDDSAMMNLDELSDGEYTWESYSLETSDCSSDEADASGSDDSESHVRMKYTIMCML